MSRVPFTEEQMQLLRDNPYTYYVTPSKLFLSIAFKEQFYRRYLNGEIPRKIFEDCGYPVDVLGSDRIWGITGAIKREYAKYGSFQEGPSTTPRTPPSPEEQAERSQEEQIRQLQHQVEYLTQEMEFLKKLPCSDSRSCTMNETRSFNGA